MKIKISIFFILSTFFFAGDSGYSKDFKDPKRSRSSWEAHKRRSLRGSTVISLQISNIKMKKNNNTINVTFVQKFKSNKMSDIGKKELIWKKEGNQWKIIEESWNPI